MLMYFLVVSLLLFTNNPESLSSLLHFTDEETEALRGREGGSWGLAREGSALSSNAPGHAAFTCKLCDLGESLRGFISPLIKWMGFLAPRATSCDFLLWFLLRTWLALAVCRRGDLLHGWHSEVGLGPSRVRVEEEAPHRGGRALGEG